MNFHSFTYQDWMHEILTSVNQKSIDIIYCIYLRMDREPKYHLKSTLFSTLKEIVNLPYPIQTLDIIKKILEYIRTEKIEELEYKNNKYVILEVINDQGDKGLNKYMQKVLKDEKEILKLNQDLKMISQFFSKECIKRKDYKSLGLISYLFNWLKMNHQDFVQNYTFLQPTSIQELLCFENERMNYQKIGNQIHSFIRENQLVDIEKLIKLLINKMFENQNSSFIIDHINMIIDLFQYQLNILYGNLLIGIFKEVFLNPLKDSWKMVSLSKILIALNHLDLTLLIDDDICKEINIDSETFYCFQYILNKKIIYSEKLFQRISYFIMRISSETDEYRWWKTINFPKTLIKPVENDPWSLEALEKSIFFQNMIYPCMRKYMKFYSIEKDKDLCQIGNTIEKFYLKYQYQDDYSLLLSDFFIGMLEVHQEQKFLHHEYVQLFSNLISKVKCHKWLLDVVNLSLHPSESFFYVIDVISIFIPLVASKEEEFKVQMKKILLNDNLWLDFRFGRALLLWIYQKQYSIQILAPKASFLKASVSTSLPEVRTWANQLIKITNETTLREKFRFWEF